MGYRALRRAIVITVAVGLLSTGAAFADAVRTDGDIVDPDLDALVELGAVAPGTVINLAVGFELQCSGFVHVNAGQRVVVTPGARSIPPGATVDYTGTTIDPPGDRWPLDGDLCGVAPDPVRAATPARVTITAPTAPLDGYLFTLTWNRALDPVAAGDFGTFSGVTAVSFTLDVVSNTPPTLVLPVSVTLEATTVGGATATYEATAIDAEDDPDPTPVCSPAAGDFVPLGSTTVSCTVTDSGGMSATGTFPLIVTDTGAPVLAGVPGPLWLATSNPDGATLAYTPPTATDTADASPAVTCSPAPGGTAPVGASQVMCTATDATGNASTASFPVSVVLWTALWDEPVGSAATLIANGGRTVPVKVRLFADGVEVRTGSATLHAARCDGSGTIVDGALAWSSGNGRWNGHLDSSALPGVGCYRVSVVLDGADVASFRLDVVGSMSPAKAKG